jgi:hypothetical protein
MRTTYPRFGSVAQRPAALVIAVVALALSVALLAWRPGDIQDHWVPWGIAAAISAAACVYWWRIVTPEWVRRSAEPYAERLFGAVETLRASQSS